MKLKYLFLIFTLIFSVKVYSQSDSIYTTVNEQYDEYDGYVGVNSRLLTEELKDIVRASTILGLINFAAGTGMSADSITDLVNKYNTLYGTSYTVPTFTYDVTMEELYEDTVIKIIVESSQAIDTMQKYATDTTESHTFVNLSSDTITINYLFINDVAFNDTIKKLAIDTTETHDYTSLDADTGYFDNIVIGAITINDAFNDTIKKLAIDTTEIHGYTSLDADTITLDADEDSRIYSPSDDTINIDIIDNIKLQVTNNNLIAYVKLLPYSNNSINIGDNDKRFNEVYINQIVLDIITNTRILSPGNDTVRIMFDYSNDDGETGMQGVYHASDKIIWTLKDTVKINGDGWIKCTAIQIGDSTIEESDFPLGSGGTPAGSNYEFQYYNGGSFGANANFGYSTNTDTITMFGFKTFKDGSNNWIFTNISGSNTFMINTDYFGGTETNAPAIASFDSDGSPTLPSFTWFGDNNTGWGRSASDVMNAFAGNGIVMSMKKDSVYLPKSIPSDTAVIIILPTTGRLDTIPIGEVAGIGGGTPAGSSGDIQYNNGGSFGGASKFTYNDVSGYLTFKGWKIEIDEDSSLVFEMSTMGDYSEGFTIMGNINSPFQFFGSTSTSHTPKIGMFDNNVYDGDTCSYTWGGDLKTGLAHVTNGEVQIRSAGDTIILIKQDYLLFNADSVVNTGYSKADSFIATSGNVYADYAFEPDYEYLPIDKQIEYAKENKHLEGITSKGGSISRRLEQAILKLEELYLIVNEQNKIINRQSSEIERLIKYKLE